ncbi:MAG: DUF1987 domain-containing protein [Bacteroidales bacterium]|nr:DUF1987 domain-containing protein [Bacteroidales bacterium]
MESTGKTPQIDLNSLTGELIFSGRSIPENASKLYENIYTWILEYVKNPRKRTNLRLNLEYFNTSSSIWLSKIAKALGSIAEPEYTLMIHLYFSIEEFENMDVDDIKDQLHPIIHGIENPSLSMGIKLYGTDDKGKILKQSMVLV